MTDASRRDHDRHRLWVPLLVLAVLALVVYLWTDWLPDHPFPGYETLEDHPVWEHGFVSGHLANETWIEYTHSPFGLREQRKMLFLLVAVGFLLAYYLPLGWKRPALVPVTFVGIVWALGWPAAGLLLAAHLLAYATFHPQSDPRRVGIGAALAAVSVALGAPTPAAGVLTAVVGAPVAWTVYRFAWYPLLLGRWQSLLQTSVANLCLIYLLVALIWNSIRGDFMFPFVLGALLFFMQWERTLLYRIDLKYGRVPVDLPLLNYLATFFSPAVLSNYPWISRIPLGYAYLERSFLARDKNRIVLSGLKLILVAVAFYFFRPVLLAAYQKQMLAWRVAPPILYGQLVEGLRLGHTPPVVTVWSSLVFEFLSFYMWWTAVAHLKVGLWRLFGYDIEPYFQKPFLSTNLLELWKRYSYYYKEFLVQAFYLPVFLRFFKKRPLLRVFVATMSAACVGNLLYHTVFAMLYFGANPDVFFARLRTAPYYMILGTVIAGTQVWMLKRRHRRRPWTGGPKIALDVLGVAGTFGFFILIRPLHHIPRDYSLLEGFRVVFAALGIG